ncbi:MAG: hypothetical protein ACREU6_08625, partial [Steroidobacteraceae bacterium]
MRRIELLPTRTAITTGLACLLAWSLAYPAPPAVQGDPGSRYDLVIRGGTIYDGSGSAPFIGDVAVQGDHIAYVGPHAPKGTREEINARGKAVAPGFVNMLA